MTFLTLSTITTEINSKTKDPILNFVKSFILTSNEYILAVQEMRNSKEDAAKQREHQRIERKECKKRKGVEKEEAIAWRAEEWEEAQREKDQRLAEHAKAQALQVVAHEEVARMKAICTAELAASEAGRGSTAVSLGAEWRTALLPYSPREAENAKHG
jgi:hypothetical protein